MKRFCLLILALFSGLANAQTVCDSLDVVSIQYSSFTDTVVIIEVENTNQWEIFDYPGFMLLNDNNDTVAVETVNYIGIGSESVHTLEVRPGVHNPQENFNGTLKLYSGFYDTFECEWTLNQSLCASTPCETVFIGFQNFGGALVVGDFHWQVDNEFGMVADSGSFTMEAQEQFWLRDLCLPAGNYTYSLTTLTSPSGGGPTLTVQSSLGFASPSLSEPLDWFNDPGAELEFPFFPFCVESPNAIDSQKESQIELRFDVLSNQILCSETLKYVEVFTSSGQLVFADNSNSKNVAIPSLGAGVYIAIVQTDEEIGSVKFLLK